MKWMMCVTQKEGARWTWVEKQGVIYFIVRSSIHSRSPRWWYNNDPNTDPKADAKKREVDRKQARVEKTKGKRGREMFSEVANDSHISWSHFACALKPLSGGDHGKTEELYNHLELDWRLYFLTKNFNKSLRVYTNPLKHGWKGNETKMLPKISHVVHYLRWEEDVGILFEQDRENGFRKRDEKLHRLLLCSFQWWIWVVTNGGDNKKRRQEGSDSDHYTGNGQEILGVRFPGGKRQRKSKKDG